MVVMTCPDHYVGAEKLRCLSCGSADILPAHVVPDRRGTYDVVMSNNVFQLVSRSDLHDVTVITASSASGLWTLVSSSDGQDVVVKADGSHVDANAWAVSESVTAFLSWVTESV